MAVVPGFGDIGSGGFFDTPAQKAARAAWMAASNKRFASGAAADPFSGQNDPRGQKQFPNEPNAVYGVRQALQAPLNWIAGMFDAPGKALDASAAVRSDVGRAVAQGTDTPRKAQARAAAPRPAAAPQSPFAQSFQDPSYDAAEQNASRITGVPVELLRAVRMRGEQTNAGVRSSAGAWTPYQIIPGTRAGIQKNYGIDPYKDATNAALGAAYVLREQAGGHGGNAPNWADPNIQARAVGGYFGGAAGAANPFSASIKDANGMSVGGYTAKVLHPDTQLPFPAIQPYDASYDNKALGELNRAEQLAMTPFSTSFNRGPMPELPTPEAAPKTDFSKSDAALEQMRPVEMTEQDKLRRERTGWFHGLAQALATMPEGANLGTFFMRLGGATLGGRMGAREDNQEAQDRFEQKMAAFNAAVYNNELGKAKTIANEAQADVAQNNAHAMDKWKLAWDVWNKGNQVDISGTNVVARSLDPTTGQETVRVLPIGPAVQSAFARDRAQQYGSMGGRQYGGNQLIASQVNSFMANQAAAALTSGDQGTADAALTAAPAFYAVHVAKNGMAPELLGADEYAKLDASLDARLKTLNLMPGSPEYSEKKQQMLAEELTRVAIGSPEFLKKMSTLGRAADAFEATNRYYGRTENTRTDARGRTSRSTSYNSDYSTQE